ncbi:capsule biosynthesis GfcC family protein [Thiomicrorhabdus sp.]|uniref:capsule biosynthesis GfcC family protein n=1 Tax=Thiomicrorhabdus sp. TaxID=2039724 RepID=UPI0029C7EEB4|nr:capsule biosynthesis GfcC family protein [Thiomicrorhabdus sp.]
MTKLYAISVFLIFSFVSMSASSAVHVRYTGCVAPAQELVFSQEPTLLQAVNQAKLQSCAYLFGAALIRADLREKQSQQKAYLLESLRSLLSRESLPLEVTAYTESLIAQIESQLVTGRDTRFSLFPTLIETRKNANPLIDQMIMLHYPSRPDWIHLLGFAENRVDYDPGLSIEQRVNSLSLLPFLKAGYVGIVQANGETSTVRVGYWSNRKSYVSPGGWIVGLFPEKILGDDHKNLNQLILNWLATQVIEK